MKFLVHAPTDGPAHVGAALTPHMNRSVWAWSSRGKVSGSPGTTAIGISGPNIPGGVVPLANVGQFASRFAPNVFYPPIYYENDRPKEHAPVSIFSDNQMPVPALRAPNVIKSNPYKARKGGQRQVKQPQIVQRFPGMYPQNG
jgi:hypothetical protein